MLDQGLIAFDEDGLISVVGLEGAKPDEDMNPNFNQHWNLFVEYCDYV